MKSQSPFSVTEAHNSALMDHAKHCNHPIDRGGVRLPAKEPDKKNIGIIEIIQTQKAGVRIVHQDEGCNHLPKMYSMLL